MRTQDYLKQISRFEAMINRKKEEINRLDIMICGTPGNGLSPDKVQTSMSGDKMSSAVAKLVDAEREVESLMTWYIQKREYIIHQIDKMPNTESYMVLSDIYVGKKTIGEIALAMDCSESKVKKIHARAIYEFEDLYGEEYAFSPTVFA